MADPRRAPNQSECIGSVTYEGLSIRVYARNQNDGSVQYFFGLSRLTQGLYGGVSSDGFIPEADWPRIVDLSADAQRLVEDHRQSRQLATAQEPERQGAGLIGRVTAAIKATETNAEPKFIDERRNQTQTRKPRQEQSL